MSAKITNPNWNAAAQTELGAAVDAFFAKPLTEAPKSTPEDLEGVIAEQQAQIVDLTERLRDSLNMDKRTQNQELIKLKNDISGALKLEYSDFQESRQEEYSNDLFEAYRAALIRTFNLLRRHGISCE